MITDEAAALIRRLMAERGMPDTAGLRVATDDQWKSLSMQLTPAPGPTDLVIRQAGVTLFLSPTASHRVAGRRLRAQLGPRRAFFLE